MDTWPTVAPVRRIITVSGAEGYCELSDDDQRDLRNRIAEIQEQAAINAGLDPRQAIVQGTGDGNLTAWGPETSELDLITNYPRELRCELDRVNRARTKSSRIRLRLAITTGLVEVGVHGMPGQAAIKAALLGDSDELQQALRKASRHSLAVILDDRLYEDVVKTGRRGLRPQAYEKVAVKDRHGKAHTAWIAVPGADRQEAASSPGDSPENGASLAADEPSASPRKRLRGGIVTVPIAVALIGAAGVITAAAITATASVNSSAPPSPNPTSSTASVSAPPSDGTTAPRPVRSPTESRSPSGSLGKLHPEETYNHLGTDVFRDPMGDAVITGPVSIPFGTHVLVKCWAPNESTMGSINAFYLIETPPWTGEYAPANTFLNSDTSGSLDPLVPECPAA